MYRESQGNEKDSEEYVMCDAYDQGDIDPNNIVTMHAEHQAQTRFSSQFYQSTSLLEILVL